MKSKAEKEKQDVQKDIKKDIAQGEFKRVYLLYGKEEFLRHSYKRQLMKAIVPPGDTMNTAVFSQDEVDCARIIDLSETMPFLSPRRLIVIEDSKLFKQSAEDSFVDYIKGNIPRETVFIFDEKEVDKRNKLYKAVASSGYVGEVEAPQESTLRNWVRGYVDKQGKRIQNSAISLLLSRIGMDMLTLRNEMEKLISYVGERADIWDRDVEEICSDLASDVIFAMVDAIADGRGKAAMDLYYEQVQFKDAPILYLTLLARAFHNILKAKEVEGRRLSAREASAIIGIPPFAVSKYYAIGKKFSYSDLSRAIGDCLDAIEDVKAGRMNDKLAVELIIIRYSGRKAGR
ncbi:MAG: DNA polymerase III subunit delta [Lachnospiraceae bacterium]|nr:DNA polymerase III subunit delta [Lachnospiraceae bacterium]